MAGKGALGVHARIEGLDQANKVFASYREAATEVDRLALVIGSPLSYAMGIETGRRPGGGVARKAGGAHMLRDGMEATQEQIPSLLAAEFERGAAVGKAIEDAIRRTTLTHVQRRTPVKSGRLRDSFTVRRGKG